MDFLIIGVVAFGASLLTFFSGFGLGTILLPAFALFFSVPLALLSTGLVHLFNNLFKGMLVRRLVDWPTVLRFGLPAIPASILGAFLVTHLDTRLSRIIIGFVLILFVILELQSWFQRLTFPQKYLSLGGALTGFVGGLSGQQGALRSMFLLKSHFDAPQYIATGILIAVLIDLARLPSYAIGLAGFSGEITAHDLALVAFGTLCALLGTVLGARFIKKTTITVVRRIVVVLMISSGVLLILGIIGG